MISEEERAAQLQSHVVDLEAQITEAELKVTEAETELAAMTTPSVTRNTLLNNLAGYQNRLNVLQSCLASARAVERKTA